jgi:RNA polymerase sigma-70 factor (ECF subfamily)
MSISTENLWNSFCCRLRAYILHRISDPSDAEDILQDVFLKIHSKIHTLNNESKIQSWIYQITRNTIIDHYRKLKFKTENTDDLLIMDESQDEDPSQELALGLREMVEGLPEKYASALSLVEFEGLSQSGLVKKLGISISGAKSRVQRGRQMIRERLMQCCHFQFDRYGTIIDVQPLCCCC